MEILINETIIKGVKYQSKAKSLIKNHRKTHHIPIISLSSSSISLLLALDSSSASPLDVTHDDLANGRTAGAIWLLSDDTVEITGDVTVDVDITGDDTLLSDDTGDTTCLSIDDIEGLDITGDDTLPSEDTGDTTLIPDTVAIIGDNTIPPDDTGDTTCLTDDAVAITGDDTLPPEDTGDTTCLTDDDTVDIAGVNTCLPGANTGDGANIGDSDENVDISGNTTLDSDKAGEIAGLATDITGEYLAGAPIAAPKMINTVKREFHRI